MTVGFRGLCVLLVALPMLVLCVQGRRENSEIDSGFAGDAAVAKRVELPSISLVIITTTRIRISSITASPELKPRFPVPQAAIDCESSVASASAQAASSASRSASGQIQQSVQSAQQAIDAASRSITQIQQQAQQSISDAQRQAQQTASQQVQQAQQTASQSVAAATRSLSSISLSAASALSQASAAVLAAQSSASLLQADASKAILQAGAALAAATGSAAAAGSSFLRAAASATANAQALASSINDAAQNQVAAATQQAAASQSAAITATQAAIAIVGSIIASSLISIILYFLVSRHKARRARRQIAALPPASPSFPSQKKLTLSEKPEYYKPDKPDKPLDETTIGGRIEKALSLKPQLNRSDGLDISDVPTSSTSWLPKKPNQGPSPNSWFQSRSSFGPVKDRSSSSDRPYLSREPPITSMYMSGANNPFVGVHPTLPVLIDPFNDKELEIDTSVDKQPVNQAQQDGFSVSGDRESWSRLSTMTYNRTNSAVMGTAIPQAIAYPAPARTVTQRSREKTIKNTDATVSTAKTEDGAAVTPAANIGSSVSKTTANARDWIAERKKRLEAVRANGGISLPTGPRSSKVVES